MFYFNTTKAESFDSAFVMPMDTASAFLLTKKGDGVFLRKTPEKAPKETPCPWGNSPHPAKLFARSLDQKLLILTKLIKNTLN